MLNRELRLFSQQAVLAVAVAFSMARPAEALIIAGANAADNYVAPPASLDAGWANSAIGRSATYLGNGWVLSATHAGLPTTITFEAGTFDVIPGSSRILTNPAGLIYYNHGNGGAQSPATTNSDIRMFRIDTASRYGGTIEELSLAMSQQPGSTTQPVREIAIASSTPGINAQIVMIASGRTRLTDQTTTITNDSGQTLTAYQVNTDDSTSRRRAWGTNRIVNDTLLANEPNDANITAVVRVLGNDTISLLAQFDNIDNEALVAAGDSGGGVFVRLPSGEYVLQGHLHSLYTNGHPANFAAFTDALAFSDLSQPHYRNQILNLLADNNFSTVGDINLDGVVSGDGTGSWETDDVTAFIEGWNAQYSMGELTPGIVSWKLGDLDQNGIVDLTDFSLLRGALGTGGASLNLGPLFGGSIAVPEPSTLCVMGGALALAAWALRRRLAR